jgi:hypothetical protein
VAERQQRLYLALVKRPMFEVNPYPVIASVGGVCDKGRHKVTEHTQLGSTSTSGGSEDFGGAHGYPFKSKPHPLPLLP